MTPQQSIAEFRRDDSLRRLHRQTEPWDIAIIGGGATGISVALDAASRGLNTCLIEQADFGKGTSSHSTKLVHGGVRYLEQGNVTLVRDALRERTLLRNNAPHLVHDMPFLIPCRSWWQRFYYRFGLLLYDFLAVSNSFGRAYGVSLANAAARIPTLQRDGLRGGVVYHDGQFDDARLLVSLARTAHQQGACLANYVTATALTKDEQGKVKGVTARDVESDSTFDIQARCVINAGGPFCDAIREMDDPQHKPMIAPSQGVHVVLPRTFFPGDTALIVPKTSDGRVIFLIPWHDHVIVGTTDTPISEATLEPQPQQQEIEFLLTTAGEYLDRQPTAQDILSVFTGIRPLVKGDGSKRTALLSRDHVIQIDDSGLVTITGGKWTTARKMAEDCVNQASRSASLKPAPCPTQTLDLHGSTPSSSDDERSYYGSDLALIQQLEQQQPELAERLDPALTIRASDVVWATRHEMARTVEDVLSRRHRALFLNSPAALRIAPRVAELMAAELGFDSSWATQQITDFQRAATNYLPPDAS